MNKTTSSAAILSISLDRASKASLQTQLLQALREFVHTGRFRSGDRLPSSRNLATELGVSRVTTTGVYEQLIAEGYLEGRQGAGVFVASDLPDLPLRGHDAPAEGQIKPLAGNQPLRPFAVGYPDLSDFPYRDWTRLHDRMWRVPDATILGRADPLGFGPLRNAIAHHLAEWRGLRCAPEQVVITAGLVDALDIFAKSVLSAGDTALVEDPGHKVAVSALQSNGIQCVPVRIDGQGFDLSRSGKAQDAARVISVTPSRHYPLGVTLPLARRLELLAWAKTNSGFILEDDYDGEFRYQGQPLPAMMSLDEDERVIYIGSFSKVMFPALRLGYMVVPPSMVQDVRDVMSRLGPRAALFAQPVLAEFIADGSFATHIRRMRRLYTEKQKALLTALEEHTSGLLSARAEAGGMHLIAELSEVLKDRMTDVQVSQCARERDLVVPPLSGFFMGKADQQGLILGYASHAPAELNAGVAALSAEIRAKIRSHAT